ncbi:uncharacterized protein HMPREF1541_00693 [Cyphellophora europaea CBS 101466]|uniref:BAG domain-containing protein n=1 Tax=Cyphellophora europaea (strain CBS 101466) TaxID=1220924 RepID=W2SEQ4_CYPE1|nr:uncharacterized protein HMPREF1541_00693 [Cyphellophora europaea CBS 101466]ETN46508.1 hypothetical protein HMPREF1541_00693 [Cyphellophora europaea CBS 101466]
MGDRSSWSYYPGRGSPFSSSLADNGPRNLSGHFEYIGDDHDLYTRSPARPSFSTSNDYPELDDNDPNAPDRVHCRYMASSFPVDFPAYSINEEKTLVEDLRRKVADRLGVDPRKVRLIYKGRDLKRNQHSLKRHKMKQNSEVSVVITERAIDYYAGDSNSESGSDRDSNNFLSANPRRQQRPRAHSTVRFRSDEKIPVLEPNGGGAYLSPNGHVPSTPVDHDRYRGREREPSREPAPRRREPSREPPRRAVSPAPPPKPASPPADPNSPLGKVQALASTFYTQFLPPAAKFLASPPADSATREKEFLKLSESIMAKVVLAADNIETEGNMDARNERKALINEANKMLKQLDVARHG